MTWHVIDEAPGVYHLLCTCGVRKWVRRWNLNTGKTVRCQSCHLKRARKSKLTDEQRLEIRLTDEPARSLAERMGVSVATIYRVRRS